MPKKLKFNLKNAFKVWTLILTNAIIDIQNNTLSRRTSSL